MKIFSTFFFLFQLINYANAGISVFKTDLSTTSNKTLAEAIDVIHDYENSCSRNCKYLLSTVSKQHILERDAQGYPTLIWQQVADQKKYANYIVIETTVDLATNIAQIHSRLPNDNEIQQFVQKYQFKHNNIFSEIHTYWNLSQKSSTSDLQINVSSKGKSSSSIASWFYSMVDKKFKQSILDAINAFK